MRAGCAAALAIAAGCAAMPNASGPPGRGLVALTFDDGPSEPATARVLDALRASGVHATFFLVGRNVERRPDLARRIVAEGHEVANHTFNHLYTLSFMPGTTMRHEADLGEQAIAAATGRLSRLLRYPVGLVLPNGPRGRAAAAAADRVLVGYTVRAADAGTDDPPDAIAARVVAAAFDGAILVLHDGHKDYACAHQEGTAAALPAILRGLAAKGLRPAPVSELLGIQPYREALPPPPTPTPEPIRLAGPPPALAQGRPRPEPEPEPTLLPVPTPTP